MSVPPAAQADLDLAVELAAAVAPLAMSWFDSVDLEIITKDDGSPVTQADVAVEAELRKRISDVDPLATIVGEEAGVSGNGARRWILDPIDGTSAFSRGVPLWSTLIGLEDEHGPAVGVIALPALGEVIAAGRGLGATFNGKPTRVSSTPQLSTAAITTWGYDKWEIRWFERLRASGANMRGWSDAYGWALLASGRVDAVIDPTTKIWDIAPMRVIIPEAGGTVLANPAADDVDGTHFEWMIGTNGALHEQVAAIMD